MGQEVGPLHRLPSVSARNRRPAVTLEQGAADDEEGHTGCRSSSPAWNGDTFAEKNAGVTAGAREEVAGCWEEDGEKHRPGWSSAGWRHVLATASSPPPHALYPPHAFSSQLLQEDNKELQLLQR